MLVRKGPNHELVPIDEAVKVLRRSKTTIYRLMRAEKIKTYRIRSLGGSYLSEKDLNRLQERLQVDGETFKWGGSPSKRLKGR